jgi:hypothetical protein
VGRKFGTRSVILENLLRGTHCEVMGVKKREEWAVMHPTALDAAKLMRVLKVSSCGIVEENF